MLRSRVKSRDCCRFPRSWRTIDVGNTLLMGENSKKRCFLCGRPAKLRCQECDWKPWYCSQPHGLLHNPGLDGDDKEGGCFPYRIVSQEGVGRCMVASRKILAGETIFMEPSALAVAPSPNSGPQCILCRTKLTDGSDCVQCRIPCCRSCSPSHAGQEECQALSILMEDEEEVAVYEAVLPLRILLSKKSDPASHAAALSLMDHSAEREEDEEHWGRTQRQVMGPLSRALGGRATTEEVERAVGVCEVNCFEVSNRTGDNGVRGVFPVTSLLSHSCSPNVRMAFRNDATCQGTCSNRCVAAIDVEEGQDLTVAYLHLHMGTRERRERLKDWFFLCACDRCKDPTEFGTWQDAVRCLRDVCKEGFLLPKDPLDFDSLWKCDKCGESAKASTVKNLVEDLLEEKNSLDRSDLGSYLNFLDRATKKLHENHYVLNATRRWILPLYCRMMANNKAGNLVTEDMLEKKLDMCRKYLYILDRVERGLTKNRGRVLYEMSDTKITLEARRFRSGRNRKKEMLQKLEECRKTSAEAAACLRFDSEETFEGYVFRAASSLLEDIKFMIRQLSE